MWVCSCDCHEPEGQRAAEEWRALNECYEASKAYSENADPPDLGRDINALRRWEAAIAAVEQARQR